VKYLAVLLVMLGMQAGPSRAAVNYELGPGDVLRITVYNHPDLATVTRVSDASDITFPLLGKVSVKGLSTSKAEAKLARLLDEKGIIKHPQVNVFVEQHRSQMVSILGYANKPGNYPAEEASTLIDLLALAGGVSSTAADTLTVTKQEGKKKVQIKVDILSLLKGGSLQQNVALAPGDVVYVPRMDVFYIYGEVQRPGMYRLERDMTVMQALSVGGGITPRGTQRGIKIKRRGSDGGMQMDKAGLTDLVATDDVIYVEESLF
jgi:polysaccharide export outer membrane protein